MNMTNKNPYPQETYILAGDTGNTHTHTHTFIFYLMIHAKKTKIKQGKGYEVCVGGMTS